MVVYNLETEKYIIPKGSTALDFAFYISENIGIQAVTCKINGVLKGLFTELKTGDIIEIITSPKCRPDSSWLNNVITFKAVSYLTKYFQNRYLLTPKSNVIQKPLHKSFIIVCKDSDILPDIQNIIEKNNIYRITIANNMKNYVISIFTNMTEKDNSNRILNNLIEINGIRMITIKEET